MITKNNRIVQMSYDEMSFEWDSYDLWLEDFKQLQQAQPQHIDSHRHDTFTARAAMSWYGCEDGFDGCMRRVETGWPELRRTLHEMMKDVELELPVFPTQSEVRRRKRKWMDQGDTLNIQRVWNGQLETAWQKPVRVNRMQPNTKRVTLAFDVSANGAVSNDQAMWRAALSQLLCDSLARAGRVFEVWVVDGTVGAFNQGWSARSKPQHLWAAWCVKQTQDPLVLDRMCSMLSIGYMRSVGFSAIAMGPYDPNPGIGGALNVGLNATLRERVAAKEVVLRISACDSKITALREYRRAWNEIEAAMHVEDAA